jgi:hypothetical protein
MTRVFISYTHDSDAHKARVQALAGRLRGDGVEVVLDQDQMPKGPGKGWTTWSEQQAARTERVLILFTASYARCWDGEQPPGMRDGATYEAQVIKERINKGGAEIPFYRPLVFDPAVKVHMPSRIARLHTYALNGDWLDYARAEFGCAGLDSQQYQLLTLAAHGDPGILCLLLGNLAQRLQAGATL